MVRIDVNADTDYDAIPEPSISGPCSPIHTSARFPPVGLFRSSYDGLYAERTEVEDCVSGISQWKRAGHSRVHSEDLQEHAFIHRSEAGLASLASIINATSVVGDAAHLVVCIIGDAARFHNPTFPIERFVQPVSRRIYRPFGVLTNFLVSHLSTLYVQEADQIG